MKSKLRVLEIGGGNSCVLPRLVKKFDIARCVIIDSNPLGVQLAEKNLAPCLGRRLNCVCADAFQRPACGHFDVVFSVGLLEHFNEPQIRALIDVHKGYLADPNSIVIITVPTPTLLYRSTRWLAERIGCWAFHDEVPIPRQALMQLLSEQGLDVLQARILWAQVLTQVLTVSKVPSRNKRR